MKARRDAGRSGVAASGARDSGAGRRRRLMPASAALLLFMLVPLVAGAGADGLLPPTPDLPATGAPSVIPSDEPLKIRDQVDDVVNGITAPPPQSPPPEGGGDPGEDPPGDEGGGPGGGGGSKPVRGRNDKPSGRVESAAPAGTVGRDAVVPDAILTAVRPVVWRAVSPGLGTMATRARSLVAPLAAPMGLGLVAVMLLGLATRGPGVISKLNEELESADGRQVWRL